MNYFTAIITMWTVSIIFVLKQLHYQQSLFPCLLLIRVTLAINALYAI